MFWGDARLMLRCAEPVEVRRFYGLKPVSKFLCRDAPWHVFSVETQNFASVQCEIV